MQKNKKVGFHAGERMSKCVDLERWTDSRKVPSR
jgi:hypothetical protein